jgi:two-component system, cell cycle response regulator DivK
MTRPLLPPEVLIVDDNAINTELVSFLLGAAGLRVACAADAEQALLRLAGQRPDLILMDIQMPGMDGLALTRRLKADPAMRAIPIVALTAYAMKGDEARVRAAGCDGYLAKPINVATFAEQVRRHLGAYLEGGAAAAGDGDKTQ